VLDNVADHIYIGFNVTAMYSCIGSAFAEFLELPELSAF